jgi:hypothetical protein
MKTPPRCNASSSKFHCCHYPCWQVSFSRHSQYPNSSVGLPHGIA